MNSKKIFLILLIILSLFFAIVTPLSLFVSSDIATVLVVAVQEVLYLSLIWLSWGKLKSSSPSIEIETPEIKKKK